MENSQFKRSNVSVRIPTSDIFPVFSLIQIHCKDTFNDSFDAEFHTLQACVIGLERFDFETVENSHRIRSSAWLCIPTPNIFRLFSFIKIHCKDRLNSSFVAEFHAVEGFVFGVERIGLESPENSRLFFLVLMFRLIDSKSESVLRRK